MRSLRSRAIVGGVVWTSVCLVLGGIALFSFFDSITLRRFDDVLTSRHLQVVIALSNSGADPEQIEAYITDPVYDRPYSGSYWQIAGPGGVLKTSRSLFDSMFPEEPMASNTPSFWVGMGPTGPIRGVHQLVSLDDGPPWVISVAESLSNLENERIEIRRNLIIAFGLIASLGIAWAILQTSAMLGPLKQLRDEVLNRWDAGEELQPEDYPEEVVPLVSDINVLLHRNRDIVERARRQAADLAHAMKTPSAILRNELETLRNNQMEVTEAIDALDRIDAQLNRSLARIRAANTGDSTRKMTDLPHSAERLARLFRIMPENEGKTLTLEIPDGVRVRMDPQDLEEVLGNLLDNAMKHAQSEVHLIAGPGEAGTLIKIEDNGPGIPEESRREALRAGGRLDSSVPGTGIGLPIATDLVQAYGGTLTLEQSKRFGGLAVTIYLPTRQTVPL